MKHTIKHKLKRVLIKCKLLTFIQPIYETLVSLWPSIKQKRDREHKERQRKLFNFYSQFIKPGDLCFDIGAYLGSRTEAFLELGARVVAVEPQERCIKHLQKKFGKGSQFTLIKKGLSNKEGELTLSICEEGDAISTFSDKWKTGRFSDYNWNKSKLVPVTTLDALIKEFGSPIFCKIDVEGFEFQVLKGLSQPIQYISFEFSKEFLDEMRSCINYLLSLGYVHFNYSFGESMQMFFPKWVTAGELYEKLKELYSIEDNSSYGDTTWGDIYGKFS